MENMNMVNATVGKMLMTINMNEDEQEEINKFIDMKYIDVINLICNWANSKEVKDFFKDMTIREIFEKYLNLEDEDEEDEIE